MQRLALVANFPCSREHIITVFCNEAYLKKKYELLGFSNFSIIASSQDGDMFSVSYQYDVNSLPAALTKLFNLQKMTTITCQYQLSRTQGVGSMSVHIPTLKHLTAQCEIVFKDAQDTASVEQSMNWQISSSMAVVGGVVEKLVSADIRKNTQTEVALIQTILHDF